ncbi:hypothetical protein FRC07_010044 [Ceratobasidium sp. 392]|nr:hypothetical protein FRC07_010044 [Ceratobasidium sp. 392]
MGYWDNASINEMEFDFPRPMENFIRESTSDWDQHVMDIDYDISQALFLVLDTNFLLKHLSLLRTLGERLLEIAHLMPPMFFVLPGVVVDELDYQSKHGVRERATAATSWLQEQIELRVRTGKGVLRAQKEEETLRGGKSWRSLRGRGENDNIILDCCFYFAQISSGQVRLLSQDRNLTLKATISDIPVIHASKETLASDFIQEVMPGLQLELISPVRSPKAADRSTASSRWAPSRTYDTPRVVVAQSSLNLSAHDVIHDDDIDMEDMCISPVGYPQDHIAKGSPIYRRLAEDPLENFIKNLQYHDVLSRAAGAILFPETPRQTLVRISKSIPSHILYFVSERGEPGYRSGGIKMWSRGDIMNATTALERLFTELGKWDDDQDRDEDLDSKEDKARARAAVVSIVRAFKEEEEQRRNSW